MENLTLTNPEVTPQITTANYHVIAIQLYWEQQTIIITLRGDNGELKTFTYGGPAPDDNRAKATQLMIALNKMNFSVNSLQKRVIQQLVNDGFIAGTVTGTPD